MAGRAPVAQAASSAGVSPASTAKAGGIPKGRGFITPALQHRTGLIRLIHVARRDLAMADDSYRNIVAQCANGKTSSGDCDVAELEAVLKHLKACGFKVKPKAGGRPLADDGQSRKMRALWLELHAAGKVRDPSEAALAAFCKRHTGVEALQWLTAAQASRLIEHLKQWQRRTVAPASSPASVEA